MTRPTGPTNAHTRLLIGRLEKTKEPIWMDVAAKLRKPRRIKAAVNVVDLERHAQAGETVVVPGVVLSNGELTKTVHVAAWRFSPAAAAKIKKAKGSAMTIDELLAKNKSGSKVRILV
ncbi:MAG: 50S ribosomal protein L18e [Candidatus Aenigmatarchaeota archaeon]